MILILAFVFGAIIGSFLNVVSLRFNTGTGLNGRSKCMSCGKQLTWTELIPVVSFLAQRGKCRKCKAKVSWQYPLIEFLAGAVFVALFWKFPPDTYAHAASTFLYIIATCLLLVIAAYDQKHKIIPDKFVYAFDALALVSVFVGGVSLIHSPHLWTLAAGPIIALPFAFLWAVSRGKWMGFGDAKLALGIGWFLGLNGGANALIWAFWIGAAVGIAWMFAINRRWKGGMEIPFGPFLILGMYAVLLFGLQAIDFRLLQALF